MGENYVWLWVAINWGADRYDMIVLGILISFERKNMLVAERFIQKFAREYGKHPVRTDGDSTWYPQACRFLKLHHHTHSYYYEKKASL